MYNDVVKFHEEILEQNPSPTPSLVSSDFMLERFKFLLEEVDEFYDNAYEGNIVGAVDGLLDTIYVALGTLYLMGIPVQQCWDQVQAANMRKQRGMTKRGNAFDAIKPAGWVGPEAGIAAIIGRAVDEGAKE